MRKATAVLVASIAVSAALCVTPSAMALSSDNTEAATLLNLALNKGDIKNAGLGTAKSRVGNLQQDTDQPMETCLVEAIVMQGGSPAPTFLGQQFKVKRSGIDMNAENEVFLYRTTAAATASFDSLITNAKKCEEDLPVNAGTVQRKVTNGRTVAKINGVQGVWIQTTNTGATTVEDWYRVYMLSGRSISLVGYSGEAAASPITGADRTSIDSLSKSLAQRISATLG